ncbi:hypothetical protein D1007_09060 [Hordeum vulgare]|nr:hypothetical protein D1007_09060 [Hordeum vulgare]
MWSVVAATDDVAFGTLAAAFSRPALAEQSPSDHSSPIFSELAVKARTTPSSRLHGAHKAVKRLRRSEVRVTADLFQRHVCLGERGVATNIAAVVPRVLSRHVLGLRQHDPRDGATTEASASHIVEDSATHLGARGRHLLWAVASRWQRWLVDLRVAAMRWQRRLRLHVVEALGACGLLLHAAAVGGMVARPPCASVMVAPVPSDGANIPS